MTYDLWLVYDVRIGWSPDGIVIYSAMSIEIDLAWWKLTCDKQLCLMRSSFILLWDDHLWEYYRAFGVVFGARFQSVDVVISCGHWSLVLIIWGFESMMFEIVAIEWVAIILVSSQPITFIDIWTFSSPLSLAWAS